MSPYHLARFRVGLSVNQPRLSPNATWEKIARTLFVWQGNHTTSANTSSFRAPDVVFVNTNNTLYAVSSWTPVYQWRENDNMTWMSLISPASTVVSVFATSNGDVFTSIVNVMNVSEIQRWTENGTNMTTLTTRSQPCSGLFVDDIDRLYCSLREAHSVVRLTLNESTNITSTVAGHDVSGMSSMDLHNPMGIFVSTNFSLYVADSGNNRVQRFEKDQTGATTAAGNGGAPGAMLNGPSAVVLDADEYLFIVDSFNSRIIGQGPQGFRCIAGCSVINGSAGDQLNMPSSLSFDSHGNIFVADTGNNRIQKFELAKKFHGESNKDFRRTDDPSRQVSPRAVCEFFPI